MKKTTTTQAFMIENPDVASHLRETVETNLRQIYGDAFIKLDASSNDPAEWTIALKVLSKVELKIIDERSEHYFMNSQPRSAVH